MVTATPNRWNLSTGQDLTAEPVLPADPVDQPPVDVPTRLAARAGLPGPAAPGVPQTVTAMRVGPHTIELFWDTVTGVTQWAPINYNIYVGGTLTAQVPGDNHSHTLTGLAASTAYSITVSAVGPGGEGSQSTALAVTTHAETTADLIPPYAATGLVEVTSAADGVLSLAWNAVPANPAVTSYKIYDGTVLKATVTAPATTGTIDVVPGASYAVTVRASNSAGDGPPNNPALTGVMPGATTVPAQVSGLALNGSVTATTVPVKWNITPKATTYKVYDGATLKTTVPASDNASTMTTTLTGYTTGTAYSITVVGSNAIGDGTASTALTGSTA